MKHRHTARKRETKRIKVKERKQQGDAKRKWQQIYTNIYRVGEKSDTLLVFEFLLLLGA